MDPPSVEGLHTALGCTGVVVLYEAVVEAFALELEDLAHGRSSRLVIQKKAFVHNGHKKL